ncbi:MAG: amino acid ABC transporter permease [Clostridia bacterium]|nr:amino acid ABC transporter permease [Clostridia bacterium]
MDFKYFNDPERLLKLVSLFLEDGVGATCSIFALTLMLSLPLGLVVALGRMSKMPLSRWPVSFYIYFMRSTPLMLQVMCIYFLLPQILPFKMDRYWAVIFAFAINYAAYFAEIFRGGIQAVPIGQREAGRVLGYTRAQVFMRIVLPQTVKHVMPAVTNEVVTLVKDTALASTVAITEIMLTARRQVNANYTVEPYLMAMIIYLVLNGVASQLCKLAERKLNYY